MILNHRVGQRKMLTRCSRETRAGCSPIQSQLVRTVQRAASSVFWSSHRSDSCRIENRPGQGIASRSDSRDLQFGIYSGFRGKRPWKAIAHLYTPELHDCRFPQLSTVPTAIRVVPIVSAEPTLSRLGVLANLPHRGSSSERFRFGADSESSAPCAIQMRCTPSRANPRYRSILCHDSTCRERQEVLEKTPKQSYRPQSDHDFSSGALFCGGSYSASLGCNVRCPVP